MRTIAIALVLVLAESASAEAIRCEHHIVLPESCTNQVGQYTVEAVNMNGWAQVSCLLSDGLTKMSWTQQLYIYAPGEPISVSKGGNASSYPAYSWQCPSRSLAAKKAEQQLRHR